MNERYLDTDLYVRFDLGAGKTGVFNGPKGRVYRMAKPLFTEKALLDALSLAHELPTGREDGQPVFVYLEREDGSPRASWLAGVQVVDLGSLVTALRAYTGHASEGFGSKAARDLHAVESALYVAFSLSESEAQAREVIRVALPYLRELKLERFADAAPILLDANLPEQHGVTYNMPYASCFLEGDEVAPRFSRLSLVSRRQPTLADELAHCLLFPTTHDARWLDPQREDYAPRAGWLKSIAADCADEAFLAGTYKPHLHQLDALYALITFNVKREVAVNYRMFRGDAWLADFEDLNCQSERVHQAVQDADTSYFNAEPSQQFVSALPLLVSALQGYAPWSYLPLVKGRTLDWMVTTLESNPEEVRTPGYHVGNLWSEAMLMRLPEARFQVQQGGKTVQLSALREVYRWLVDWEIVCENESGSGLADAFEQIMGDDFANKLADAVDELITVDKAIRAEFQAKLETI